MAIFLAIFPRFARENSRSARAGPWSVEHDRHRAGVHEGYCHTRSEDAPFDRDALGGEGLAELLVERFGLLGRALEKQGKQLEANGHYKLASSLRPQNEHYASRILDLDQEGDEP